MLLSDLAINNIQVAAKSNIMKNNNNKHNNMWKIIAILAFE